MFGWFDKAKVGIDPAKGGASIRVFCVEPKTMKFGPMRMVWVDDYFEIPKKVATKSEQGNLHRSMLIERENERLCRLCEEKSHRISDLEAQVAFLKDLIVNNMVKVGK